MPVPSLVSICQSKVLQQSASIQDIGSTPYHLIEPLLRRKTAKSVKTIEDSSPQVRSESDRIWYFLLERDFSDKPRSRDNCRELYAKYESEHQSQFSQVETKLKMMKRKLIQQKSKVKQISVLPVSQRKQQQLHARTHVSKPTYKSSLLEKARLVNKQRAQNFKRTH